MTTSPRFLDLPDELARPENARAAIVPVPYDRTATWKKGADRGPAAIIEASNHIELYDLATASEPCLQGIVTGDAITCTDTPEVLADLVDAEVTSWLQRGVIPVLLGGDHSVSIGAIRAAARHQPQLTVLQIDAHADTREEYAGSTFNHACVMTHARRWCEIVQVGIRAVDATEMEHLDQTRVVWASEINGPGADPEWIDRVVTLLGDKVYVTIDVDGFDPAYVPATGTPEPGGLDWYQVTALLERVAGSSEVVAFDVVELCPTPGQWASDFLAAKLVHRFLGYIFAGP